MIDVKTVERIVEEKSKELNRLLERGKSITFNMGKLHSLLELREAIMKILDDEINRIKKSCVDKIKSKIAKSEMEEDVEQILKRLRDLAEDVEGVDDCLKSVYRLRQSIEETINNRIYKILDELE